MKKIVFTFLLILSVQFLQAQKTISLGAGSNAGLSVYRYSISMDLTYRPYIPNSIPFDFYAFGSYQFLKRFELLAGAGLDYEKFNLDYKDVIRTDSLMNSDPSIDKFTLQNQPVMYHDNMNLMSLFVPLNLRFYIFSKFFISAGITSRYYFNKRVYKSFELSRDIGMGMQYPKWSLGLSVATPTRSNGIKMINNNQPNREFQDYLIFSKRCVNLSFTYRLSRNNQN